MATLHPKLYGLDEDTTINETPGVNGGYPRIGNTRVPVRSVVLALRELGSIEAVADYFAHLTQAQIDAALAYYADFPTRVDEDMESNARAYAEFVARNPDAGVPSAT